MLIKIEICTDGEAFNKGELNSKQYEIEKCLQRASKIIEFSYHLKNNPEGITIKDSNGSPCGNVEVREK